MSEFEGRPKASPASSLRSYALEEGISPLCFDAHAREARTRTKDVGGWLRNCVEWKRLTREVLVGLEEPFYEKTENGETELEKDVSQRSEQDAFEESNDELFYERRN